MYLEMVKDFFIYYFYNSLINIYLYWFKTNSINRIMLKQKSWHQDICRITSFMSVTQRIYIYVQK